MTALVVSAAHAANYRLLDKGTEVRFASAPVPADWADPGFDDSKWPRAAMPLVGEGRTEPMAPAPSRILPGVTTLYARARVAVPPGATNVRTLVLSAQYGDGLVVYLDGVEIVRKNVPAGATADTVADFWHGTDVETFYKPLSASLRAAPGEHVLAVEVHARRPKEGPLLDLELAATDAVQLTRGPYLIRPGASEMTISWETDSEVPGEVRFGKDANYGETVKSSLPVKHHTLRLRGLKPARLYHYRVLSGGVDSGDATFHTLPGADKQLRVAVYGDTRNGHDVHERVINQVLKEDPDLVVMVGDLVDRGFEETDWQRFFEVAAPLLRVLPLVPALGNHEVTRPEGTRRFLELFPTPPGAPEPGYFSFDAGGVHFTVLDSNQLRSPRQAGWCEADLAAAKKARARFVVMHQGPWSMGPHGDSPDAIRTFVPLFQKYGVDLILSGHDHEYERGVQQGLRYVVTGGGGAPLYQPRCGGEKTPGCGPGVAFLVSDYHYLTLVVARDSFRLCSKKIDGTELEPCQDFPLRGKR
jgi:hypothetical protein